MSSGGAALPLAACRLHKVTHGAGDRSSIPPGRTASYRETQKGRCMDSLHKTQSGASTIQPNIGSPSLHFQVFFIGLGVFGAMKLEVIRVILDHPDIDRCVYIADRCCIEQCFCTEWCLDLGSAAGLHSQLLGCTLRRQDAHGCRAIDMELPPTCRLRVSCSLSPH